MYQNYQTWLKAKNNQQIEDFILTEGFHWLDSLQTHYGASKPLTHPNDLMQSTGWRALGVAKNAKHKDKITYRSKWHRDKNDIEHLLIQFNCFQGGGDVQTFNSSKVLYDRYLRERHDGLSSDVIKPISLSRINNLFETQLDIAIAVNETITNAITTEKEAKRKAEEEAEEKRKAEAVKYFNEVYESLPSEGASLYFSESKHFPPDFWQGHGFRFGNDAELKYIQNKKGNFVAVQLRSAINGEPLGLQIIYDDGTKKLTYGTKKSKVPCTVFGDIEQSKKLIFTESVANSIVINKTVVDETKPNVAVIFCVDAENLKKVVKEFAERYPDKEGIVVCDNDKWKYDRSDNVGVLKGVEAAKNANYKCVIPNFSQYDQSNQPTDIWDLYHLGGIEAVAELLDNPQSPQKGHDWYTFKLNRTGLRDTDATFLVHHRDYPQGKGREAKKALEPLYQAVKALCASFSHRIPLESFDKVIDEVLDHVDQQSARLGQYSHFDKSEQEELLKYAVYSLEEAYADGVISGIKHLISKEKTDELEKKGVRVIRYDLKLIDGKCRIPPKIAEKIVNAEDGLHIISSPKDTGKTYSIIKPVIDREISKNNFPLITSPLCSLSRDLSGKCNIDNYQDIKNTEMLQKTQGLVITINSTIKSKFAPYIRKSKSTVVDEIDAVYDAITIGTVEKEDREKTYHALQEMLGHGKAVVASADIDDNCLNELLKTRDASEITLYIADPAPVLQGHTVTVFDEQSFLLKEFQAQVNNDIPCILTSDNVTLVESQAKKAEELGIETLCITSNTINQPKVKKFFEDPNKYIEENKPRLVAYTPAIAMGLSINVEHFQIVYGVYCQQTTENGFLQQIARSRQTKDYRLAFPSRRRPEEMRDKAIERTKSEILETYNQTRQLIKKDNGQWAFPASEEIALSDFDNIRVNSVIAQSYEKSPNNILRRLVSEGAEIPYQDTTDEEEIAQAKAEQKAIKKEFNQAKINEILEGAEQLSALGADKISEITQEAIKSHQENIHLDSTHEAALLRATYHTDTISEELIKFDQKKGLMKVLNLEKTLTAEETAIKSDESEQQILPISLLSHDTLKQNFNTYLMEKLSITLNEEYDLDCNTLFNKDSKAIKEIINSVAKNKDAFNGCMPAKFTNKTYRDPIPFIRNWLLSLGLKIQAAPRSDANSPRDYFIDTGHYSRLVAPILKGRKQQGKNCLLKRIEKYEGLINKKVSDTSSDIYIYEKRSVRDNTFSDVINQIKQAKSHDETIEILEANETTQKDDRLWEVVRDTLNDFKDSNLSEIIIDYLLANQPVSATPSKAPQLTKTNASWANPDLTWHQRLQDFYLNVKKGVMEEWLKIKNTNPLKWNELKAELERYQLGYQYAPNP